MNNVTVIRVEKTKNYTVMANYHLRDKRLSFKAKGLMSFMLSLPDDWDYTVNGLSTFATDGRDGVRASLRELEGTGYLRLRQSRSSGRFNKMEYTLTEKPFTEKPITESPITENPTLLSTKVLNTKEKKKENGGNVSSLSPILEEIKTKWEGTFHPLMKADELETLEAYIQDYGRMGVISAIETAGKRKNLNHATLSPRYLLPILKNPMTKPDEPQPVGPLIPKVTETEKEMWARLKREDDERRAKNVKEGW